MGGVDGNRRLPRRAGAILVCGLVLAGCGNHGGGTTDSGSGAGEPAPVNRTGVSPREARSALHLGRRDCHLLGAALSKRSGHTVHISSEPKPPHSGCSLEGHGIDVHISLDTSYGAHQRFENRVVEAEQFGTPDQARMPHPVPGVGEPGAYGHNAQWIPALGTLLAVRGNRWLTVNYAAAGRPPDARKLAAAAVARRAFKLSAR